MTWKTLGIGILSVLLVFSTAQAQEAAPAISSEATPTEPRLPSRANNFNLPNIVQFNGERVTEGFWVFTLCGKPLLVVYDSEDQMSLPIFGQPLLRLAAQKPWELEDGPQLLQLPDLTQLYPALAEMCEILSERAQRLQHDNEKVTPPPTRMK